MNHSLVRLFTLIEQPCISVHGRYGVDGFSGNFAGLKNIPQCMPMLAVKYLLKVNDINDEGYLEFTELCLVSDLVPASTLFPSGDIHKEPWDLTDGKTKKKTIASA